MLFSHRFYQATQLLYHIFLSLSSLFLNFFKKVFQDFLCDRHRPVRQLLYYITYLSVCQVLFWISFRKFSANFLSEVQKTFPSKIPYFSLSLRPTALLLYHVIFQLSSRRNSYFSDVFCRISTKPQIWNAEYIIPVISSPEFMKLFSCASSSFALLRHSAGVLLLKYLSFASQSVRYRTASSPVIQSIP